MEWYKFFTTSLTRKTFSDGSKLTFSVSRECSDNINEEQKNIRIKIKDEKSGNKLTVFLENAEEFDKIFDAITFLKSELISPVVRVQ